MTTKMKTCNHSIGGSVVAILTLMNVAPALSYQLSNKAELDACRNTPYPDECLSSLTFQGSTDPKTSFLIAALRSSVAAVQLFRGHCKFDAMDVCGRSLESAERYFNSSISHMERPHPGMEADVLTWLSASVTYHTTCIDDEMRSVPENLLTIGIRSMVRATNSLSIARTMLQPPKRQHPSAADSPSWMRVSARHLLQSDETQYDTVVAQDGSGNYSTVQAAVNSAPAEGNTSYIIRIKQGVYNELVNVPSGAHNVMFVGDGIDKTIIRGNVSVQANKVTTFRTATVAIDGDGFLAKDVTFQNTAGAKNHQAVATRVDSDKAAFYRCSFEGYQDTLYAHSLRQFYRSCSVYGTEDFIFGNAAAAFQNCNLVCRLPLKSQNNTVTAQGRTSPDQDTGFSFQNCSVTAAPELASSVTSTMNQSVKSFLGRPWKEYSRTVFMSTYMMEVVNAAGWTEWNRSFALATLFYGEYQNSGPGGTFTYRVSWATEITDPDIAAQYSVSFNSGAQWLPQTGIPYSSTI